MNPAICLSNSPMDLPILPRPASPARTDIPVTPHARNASSLCMSTSTAQRQRQRRPTTHKSAPLSPSNRHLHTMSTRAWYSRRRTTRYARSGQVRSGQAILLNERAAARTAKCRYASPSHAAVLEWTDGRTDAAPLSATRARVAGLSCPKIFSQAPASPSAAVAHSVSDFPRGSPADPCPPCRAFQRARARLLPADGTGWAGRDGEREARAQGMPASSLQLRSAHARTRIHPRWSGSPLLSSYSRSPSAAVRQQQQQDTIPCLAGGEMHSAASLVPRRILNLDRPANFGYVPTQHRARTCETRRRRTEKIDG